MSLTIVGQPGPKATLTPQEVEQKIRLAIPDAEIKVTDLTGTQDHYEVQVSSASFRDLSLVEQHQRINQSLAPELASNVVHALAIKTSTPAA